MGPSRTNAPSAYAKRALLAGCMLLCGCSARQSEVQPRIEFLTIPPASEGGPLAVGTIAGRVTGARPEQRIVLFARSGLWYVQPFVDEPFTTIAPDGTWTNSTHLGTDYAALLVEPEYRPPGTMDGIPTGGGGLLAVAVAEGTPRFWRTWWFRLSVLLTVMLAGVSWYRARMRQLTRELNLRFEERLAERTRIAQELHDTLLQGFVGASMQLHVGLALLPQDSPARPVMGRVAELMGQVIDEGRNALRGLRAPDDGGSLDLEQALSRVQQELAVEGQVNFRVIVEGRSRPLHPIIRDEIYGIARQALVNAFRHAGAKTVEVEVEFAARRLRVLVRDDGGGIDAQALRSGREGHRDPAGMQERAERIGAKLRVWSHAAKGTEVELSVPGQTAYQGHSSNHAVRWFARFRPRWPGAPPEEARKRGR